MNIRNESGERVITLERPKHHFVLLIASDGAMLGLDDDGDPGLFDEADDRVIWDRNAQGVRHAATGKDVPADIRKSTCSLPVGADEVAFSICQGPEKLPSEYLEHLQREGWVCLNAILAPETVDGLASVACTERYEHQQQNTDTPKICQHAAVGRALAEPISLWLLRQYMQTRDLHLGHPPGFGVVEPNKLATAGRGWHSDIPYTPSTSGQPVFDRKGPPKACNRNVCVSDFTQLNGATAFRLGSHKIDSGPPEEWNAALQEDEPGLPYNGSESTVLEAPGGSIVLYDSRTWHRAGMNRSQHKRSAMLTSFQTPDVIPKRDSRPACKRLHDSPVYQELNPREQRDVTELLMNQPEVILV
ncbi:MAG: phytanoyl-CoA dioxygenase family protein [Proteobacteria bacterium]|nr:phytanoyl-CoA dioxygenase family protein [Pseudomonadota bacterium]